MLSSRVLPFNCLSPPSRQQRFQTSLPAIWSVTCVLPVLYVDLQHLFSLDLVSLAVRSLVTFRSLPLGPPSPSLELCPSPWTPY